MNKNRHIIGELQEFFANNDASKAINSISSIMEQHKDTEQSHRISQESELQVYQPSGFTQDDGLLKSPTRR